MSRGPPRDRPEPPVSPSPRRSSRAETPRRRARAAGDPPAPAARRPCCRPARHRPRWRRMVPPPQPSPQRGEGASILEHSPRRGEGASILEHSPWRGEGASILEHSPRRGEGASILEHSPRRGEGASILEHSPWRGEGARIPRPRRGRGQGEGALKPSPSPFPEREKNARALEERYPQLLHGIGHTHGGEEVAFQVDRARRIRFGEVVGGGVADQAEEDLGAFDDGGADGLAAAQPHLLAIPETEREGGLDGPEHLTEDPCGARGPGPGGQELEHVLGLLARLSNGEGPPCQPLSQSGNLDAAGSAPPPPLRNAGAGRPCLAQRDRHRLLRSEEHTSEL